jgi:hypothetical protein
VAAAILVTTLNSSGTMTLPFVLVASIVLPLIGIPTAKRLGDRGAAILTVLAPDAANRTSIRQHS